MLIPELREQLKKLPAKPGIYLFKNLKSKPLYIGKALNLRNRVKNYSKSEDPRLIKMLSDADKIDFIPTESDIEALILESQYIKRYQPPFNIMLRDDKQYGFVGFTQEEFPKIFITHQPTKQRSSAVVNSKISLTDSTTALLRHQLQPDYIGPFTEIGALKTTLRLLRKIFPYCTCKQLHNNYCLNYHIGKCLGFCCLKDNPERSRRIAEEKSQYLKNVKAIKDILSGKKSTLITILEKEMHKLAGEEKFEKASELQNKIEKIKRVFENAQIIRNIDNSGESLKELAKVLGIKSNLHRIEAYDIANIQGKHAVGAMVVFIDGQPDNNQYRRFKIQRSSAVASSTSIKEESSPTALLRYQLSGSGGDTAMLKEVLIRRFNHPEWSSPDLILVDGGKGQLNVATEVLRIKNQEPVRMVHPGGLRIPIIALTKNEYHIGHKITLPDKEILLSQLPIEVRNLLLRIDSEAHRFAINYYRGLHRRKLKRT